MFVYDKTTAFLFSSLTTVTILVEEFLKSNVKVATDILTTSYQTCKLGSGEIGDRHTP